MATPTPRTALALALLLVLCSGVAGVAAADTEEIYDPRDLDLTVAADRARAFLVTRGSTDPEQEVVFHWKGTIYSSIPADPTAAPQRSFGTPLLHFEGYNVARFVEGPEPGTRRMLSREVTLYQDPATGELLDCWTNPHTGEAVRVLHVWNDPVNFTVTDAPYRALGDQIVFTVEVPLAYPSPLPVAEYPEASAGNTYQSTELFDFFVLRDRLTDDAVSVPATLAWTRTGQWLPWMRMGQRAGGLVYHATGQKLRYGYAELPEAVREVVEQRAPAYANAPTTDEQPNATSWRYYMEQVQAGAYQPTCTPD